MKTKTIVRGTILLLGLSAASCADLDDDATLDEGSIEQASFGGSNGKIAFASAARTSAPQQWDIFTMNANGTGVVNLTNNPAADDHPSWSADGQKIVFTSYRDGNYEIYTMTAAGGSVTRVTNNAAVDDSASFSPDGTKVVFRSNRSGTYAIYTQNADGTGSAFKVTNGAIGDTAPVWSNATVNRIVYTKGTTSGTSVHTVKPDGTGDLTVSPATQDFNPNWSPDGTRIVVERARPVGGYDVVNLPIAGGTSYTVGTSVAAGAPPTPAWSPDGTKIIFNKHLGWGFNQMLTVPAFQNNGPATVIGQSGDLHPDWQPIP